MIHYLQISRIYTNVWSKYRPVVLKLMSDSANGPQQYKFSPDEFRRINPKEKGGFGFTLHIFQGNAVNNIKASPVAKDLLWVLQQSKRALELTGTSSFELILDKKFVFHVIRKHDIDEVVLKESEETSESVSDESVPPAE